MYVVRRDALDGANAVHLCGIVTQSPATNTGYPPTYYGPYCDTDTDPILWTTLFFSQNYKLMVFRVPQTNGSALI